MYEILIDVIEEEKRIAYVENGRLEEFYLDRESGEQYVGNIYKGRIIDVVPSVQAAFVDIGLVKNGFLHISDILPEIGFAKQVVEDEAKEEFSLNNVSIEGIVRSNQEVVVQIIKAPFGEKGPRLTTNITIPGRKLVFLPFTDHNGVSKKIRDKKERARLREIVGRLKLPSRSGIIIRTAGEGSSEQELKKELKYLLNTWKRIQKKMRITKTPACVHKELDLVLRVIRDSLSEEVNKVIVNSKLEYKRIKNFIKIFLPNYPGRVELYSGERSLFSRYNLEEQLKSLFSRKVWLKSGGYLVVDKTEGCFVIDVNSGKYVKPKDLEETALTTNLEAAREIPRQLRLRNLSGIILIDFIDMENITHQRLVLKELKEAAKKDRVKVNIYPFTRLGMVQIARERVRGALESYLMGVCPYCAGKGKVKTPETVAIEIKRILIDLLPTRPSKKKWQIHVNPEVERYIIENGIDKNWERFFKRKFIFVTEPAFHRVEYKIIDY